MKGIVGASTPRRFDIALVAGILLLASSTAYAANSDNVAKNPYLGNAKAEMKGRNLYARHCIVCHGQAGGRGPDLFQNTLTDREFLTTVLGGKSGARGQMPSWGGRLTIKDIWYVEAFVKSADHF